MPRDYKWQPHSGARHAIPQGLAPNDAGSTLCGIELKAGPDTWPEDARCWPTCVECDLAWRAAEHILPWPRKGCSAMIASPSAATATSNTEPALQP
jgi:hypothetical protein